MTHDQFYDLCWTGGSCPYPAYQEDMIYTRICLQRSIPQLQLTNSKIFQAAFTTRYKLYNFARFSFRRKTTLKCHNRIGSTPDIRTGGRLRALHSVGFPTETSFHAERRKKRQQTVYILQKSSGLKEGRVWVVIWFSCGWQTRWQRGLRRNWHFQGWQGPARMWRDRAPSRVLFALEN